MVLVAPPDNPTTRWGFVVNNLLLSGGFKSEFPATSGTNAFARCFIAVPSVTAVHAGGLATLNTEGKVFKTFAYRPFSLRLCDGSEFTALFEYVLMEFGCRFHSRNVLEVK